jgi:hypothetical protein
MVEGQFALLSIRFFDCRDFIFRFAALRSLTVRYSPHGLPPLTTNFIPGLSPIQF